MLRCRGRRDGLRRVRGRRVGRLRFPFCAASGEAADRDPSSLVPARRRDPSGPRRRGRDRCPGDQDRTIPVRTALDPPTQAEPGRTRDRVGPVRAGLLARHRDRTGLLLGHTGTRLGETARPDRGDHQHRVRTDPLRTAPDQAAPARTGPDRAALVRTSPVLMVQVRTAPRRTGRAHSDLVRTGPVGTGLDAVPGPAGPDHTAFRRGRRPTPERLGRTQGLPIRAGRRAGPAAGHRNTSRRPGGRRTRLSAGHAGEQRGCPGEPTVRSG